MSFYYLAYILIFSTTRDSSVYCSMKDKGVQIQIKAEIEERKEPLIQLVDKLNLALENLKVNLKHDKRERKQLTKSLDGSESTTTPSSELNTLLNNTTLNTTAVNATTITTKKKPIKKKTKKPKKTTGDSTTKKPKKKRKKTTISSPLGNIFRSTAIQGRTTAKIRKTSITRENDGPFTNLILGIMDHFIQVPYEEAYAYAWVIREKLTYSYIYNNTGLWRLGRTFVHLLKNTAFYATIMEDINLQKRIAYIRGLMGARRQYFTPGFNEVLDYADSIITERDKIRFTFFLKDLRDPRKQREILLRDFMYQSITRPLERIPNYEVELLEKRITYEIEHSKFNVIAKAARHGDYDGEDYEKDKEKTPNVINESSQSELVNEKPQVVTPIERENIFSGFKTILENVASLF